MWSLGVRMAFSMIVTLSLRIYKVLWISPTWLQIVGFEPKALELEGLELLAPYGDNAQKMQFYMPSWGFILSWERLPINPKP